MDLMYMAGVAEDMGCECRITDYTLSANNEEQFINDLKEFRPDYLLVSVATATLAMDLRACAVAKKYALGVITIAKGAHFLRFNTKVLEDFPETDMLIRGEPEITFQEIVSGKSLNDIKGITWREGDRPVNNPDRPFVHDLDSLPFPARHLINNSCYRRPDNGRVQAVIKVARGCPYNCFFCLATPVSGSAVRKRSPENILKEVMSCIEKYNIKDFLFWSDIFSLDKQWVIDLCRAIIGSGLKFRWAANTRADTIDFEMAKMMKKAGCDLVSIGVESGNQDILDRIGKKIAIEEIKKSFLAVKKSGLKIFAYYIIGLPWETAQTAEDTIRLAIELDSDYVNFFTATPFPGTRFFDYALEKGLFECDERNFDKVYADAYYYPAVKGQYLSRAGIFELYQKAIKRFYLRPKYILKMLLRIRSWKELCNYFKAGLCVIQNSKASHCSDNKEVSHDI